MRAEENSGQDLAWPEIEFWFEFASTYSYPAAMRIEELAGVSGVRLTWRPFLLGPIFRDQGWSDSPFNLFPAKGRYMWRDLERICSNQGIPFSRPGKFPQNGLLAARVASRFSGEAWIPDFVRSVYLANFRDNLDISCTSTVSSCLDGLTPDPAASIAEASSPASKDLLRRQTERAKDLGIFGAPSLTVGGELFWGNDRVEEAIAWAVDRAARNVQRNG